MTSTITVITCRDCGRDRPDDQMPCECKGGPNRWELWMEQCREAGRKLREKHDQRLLDAVFGNAGESPAGN